MHLGPFQTHYLYFSLLNTSKSNMKTKFILPLFCSILLSIIAVAQSNPEDFVIQTKVGTFLPDDNAGVTNLSGTSSNHIFLGNSYQIIQFYDLPTENTQASLKNLGIKLIKYVPKNAYIAAIPSTIDPNQLVKLNIRTIIEIPSIYRMSTRLMENLPDYATDGKQVDIILNYYEDLPLSAIVKDLSGKDIDILETNENNHYLILRIPIDNITQFGTLPYVEWVDLIPGPGEAEDRGGRTIHRSNVINNKLSTGYRFDGEGVKVLVRDDGLVGPHIDYTGRLTNLTTDATGTHGDGVAGVMSGGGNLDPTITGMAPGSDVYVINYASLFSSDNTLSLHQNDGVKITNSSYSNGCNDGYTTTTQVVDDQTYQNPTLLHVFSAGNSNNNDCGYGAGNQWGNITGGHKIGKNVIATANLFADGSLVSSSSRGPAADGRLKPDISAHGQGQLATNPNNAYQTFGGTSAAAPGIAGVSAQLYQVYKSLNGGTDPEAALIKATLMNTADEMGNLGPDFKYGWGRVNGFKALKLLESGRYLDGTIINGQSLTHTITVPAGVKQVKAMVYWAEPAPASISGPALINNLDIKLTTPGNVEYLPWILDPTPDPAILDLPAVRGVDNLNNVEQVTLDDPAAGSYTLNIEGTSIPMGPQKYYVVYDFIYDEVMVTYPLGGEGLVPNTTERIHWDAFGTQGTFLLEYTTNDGANWTTIATVNGTERLYSWNIPNTITGAAKVRVTRGDNSDESDETFSIIDRPSGITVSEVCGNSIKITWNSVASATGYDIFLLGNKTMEVVGSSTTNTYELTNVDPFGSYWVSVRATGANGIVGRRANAVNIAETQISCPLPYDILTESIISPIPDINTCFEAIPKVKINIKNQGLNEASQFAVAYRVNDGTIVTENILVPLPSSSEMEFTFNSAIANLNLGAVNNLKVWVYLPDDDFRGNDTLELDFFISDVSLTVPFVTNFNDQVSCSTIANCQGTSCPLTNNWENLQNGTADDIDWRTHSGSTSSSSTGPSNDYDLGNSTGKYLYLETSSSCNFETATLLSPCLDLTGSTAPQFYFYYHMYGTTIGELHLDLFDGNQWITDISAPITGNQGNTWHPYTLDLTSYKDQSVQLRIRGITGSSYTGDIAIDNIGLKEIGLPLCPQITNPLNGTVDLSIVPRPITWNHSLDATGYTIKIGTTNGGDEFLSLTDVGNVQSYTPTTNYNEAITYYITLSAYNALGNSENCTSTSFKTFATPLAPWCEDAENHPAPISGVNRNGWTSIVQNDYQWNTQRGGTGSNGTGPSNASDGANYFYAEASFGGFNDTAFLYSPAINISNLSLPYLVFDYHMYGASMGSIRVDVFDGNEWTNGIWSLAGQQQTSNAEAWRTASISLNAFSSANLISLRFVAVRGTSFIGDIAIDNICVENLPPPTCVALQTPTSGENLVIPTTNLTWLSQQHALGYQLKIGTSPNGSEFLANTDVGNVTSYTPSTPFDYLTTYYVTVSAYNDLGVVTGCQASYFKTIYDISITECGEVQTETYCYGNSNNIGFPYSSSDPTIPLKVDFVAGKMEVPFDKIHVYDGNSTSGALLYSGNNDGDLSGLSFTTTSSGLFIVIESDESVSCATGSACCNTPLQWEISRVEAGGSGTSSNCECDPNNANHQNMVIDGISAEDPQIVPNTYQANVSIESKGYVKPMNEVHFKAGSAVRLKSGFHAQSGSFFSAQIANCGNAVNSSIVAASRQSLGQKKTFANTLLKVYPNPFYDNINIEVNLKEAATVNLVVYDQLGQQVKAIVQQNSLTSGQHSYTFSGQSLKSGIYFLHLNTANERVVRKFIKIE